LEYKLLLLGLLRHQDMYGYQLYEFLDNNLGVCVQLKKPTAYKLLNQMAQDGWVTFREEQEGNRPTRRVYVITPKGETAFQELLRQSLSSYQATEFLSDLSLMFLDVLSAAEAIPLLEQRRAAVYALLQEVESYPPHPGSVQFMIEHQRRHYAAEVAWLDDVIHQVKSSEKTIRNEL
jgi:DNA-binding PadR family transcriptional regulator